MKVRELIKFLQNVDQNAEVLLEAGHSEALEQNKLFITECSLTINLRDFVYEEEEYNDMLGAL